MPGTGGSMLEVLSGKESIKLDVSINTLSFVWLGVTVLVAVALAVIIAKKVS